MPTIPTLKFDTAGWWHCGRTKFSCLSFSRTHVVDLCVVDVVLDGLIDFYGGAGLENRVHDADGDMNAPHHVPTMQQLVGGEHLKGAGAVVCHTPKVFGGEPDKGWQNQFTGESHALSVWW